MDELAPGLTAELEHTVTDADTASKWGSGLVPVFSTPALVGLMESAAVAALDRAPVSRARRPSAGTLTCTTWLPRRSGCRCAPGRS